MRKTEGAWDRLTFLACGVAGLVATAVIAAAFAAMLALIASAVQLVDHGSPAQDAVFAIAWAGAWAAISMETGYRAGRASKDSPLTPERADALMRFARMAIVWSWIDTGVEPRAELRRMAKEAGLVREMDRGAAGEPARYEGVVKWLM
jgi:hypothetical protein